MLLLFPSDPTPPSGGGGFVSTIAISIGGTDKTSTASINQMTIDMTLGSDWTASVVVMDTDSTSFAYRPTLDQSITIMDGPTRLFNGTIVRVEDKPITGPHIGTETVITARAKSQLVDQIIVNETFTAGQTLNVVTSILGSTYLLPYGITTEPMLVTGPVLEEQVFQDVTLRDVFNHLSTVTGFLWRITPGDELQFFTAGDKTASYALTAANKLSMGPVQWDKNRQQYVNSVRLRYGTETVVSKTFTATGTGSVNAWVLDYYPATGAGGYLLSAGYVTENGNIYSTLSPPGEGGMYTWTAATNVLTRVAGNLPLGDTATLVYSVQFPYTVTVEDAGEIAAHGKYAALFEAPDIFDKDAAAELAAGLLRRALAVPQWVRLSTRQGFVMPGDQIALTFSDRIVSGNHLITQVHVRTIAYGIATYDLTCLSGGESQQTWTDQLRDAIGSGGTNSAGGTITGSIVPNLTSNFDDDVVANSGDGNTLVGPWESGLFGRLGNASVLGPAVGLGRSEETFRWWIVANTLKGSTPGTVSSLEFVSVQDSSTYRRAVTFTQADTPVAGEYYLVGSVPGKLSIGAPSGTLSGFSGNARMEAVYTNGLFELNRSVAAGYWTPVAFSAGNFTASGAMTWTVGSGDQVTYAYTLLGKTMTIAFALNTTTVGGTPDTELRIAVPGGFTINRDMFNPIWTIDNGVEGTGLVWAASGTTVLRCYRPGRTNWAAATDATYVWGEIEFEVQ